MCCIASNLLMWEYSTYHYFQNLSIVFLYSLFHLVFFSLTATLYYRVYPNSGKTSGQLFLRNFPKDCAALSGRLRVPRRSLVIKAEKTIMVTSAVLGVVLGGNFRWPTLIFFLLGCKDMAGLYLLRKLWRLWSVKLDHRDHLVFSACTTTVAMPCICITQLLMFCSLLD